MSGFMGPGKPSSLVTTLLNLTSLLQGGLVEGEWGSLGWRSGWTIAGMQDFIEQGSDFDLVATSRKVVLRET
jgi:hypothetical protein